MQNVLINFKKEKLIEEVTVIAEILYVLYKNQMVRPGRIKTYCNNDLCIKDIYETRDIQDVLESTQESNFLQYWI